MISSARMRWCARFQMPSRPHAFHKHGFSPVCVASARRTTARILARALNYRAARTDQSLVRPSRCLGSACIAAPSSERRHIDVIEMDAASHNGVDNVRQINGRRAICARECALQGLDPRRSAHALVRRRSTRCSRRWKSRLPHVKFIFATTEIRKVPVTILSRCQRFDLRRIDARAPGEASLCNCRQGAYRSRSGGART